MHKVNLNNSCNLNNELNFKLFLLQLLQFIIGGIVIGLYCFAFQKKFLGLSYQNISETIVSIRAAGIFLITWFILLIIIQLWITPWKNINKLNIILVFLSISYLSLIFSFIWFFCSSNLKQNKLILMNWFKTDYNLKETYSRKSWQYILAIIMFIFMLQTLFCTFYTDKHTPETFYYLFNNSLEEITYKGLWFRSLHFFTVQTNLLCLLFITLFVINPGLKIFKYNSFLIYCTTYILIVGLVYDLILLPTNVISNKTADWDWFNWYSTIVLHFINPIFFVTFGLLLITHKRKFNGLNLIDFTFWGMLIPLAYLVYSSACSFISPVSVYGYFTNLNPLVLTSNDLNSGGAPWRIIIILGFGLIFAGLIIGQYFIDRIFIKKSGLILPTLNKREVK